MSNQNIDRGGSINTAFSSEETQVVPMENINEESPSSMEAQTVQSSGQNKEFVPHPCGGKIDREDEDYSLLSLLPFLTRWWSQSKSVQLIPERHQGWLWKLLLSCIVGAGYIVYFTAVLLISKTNVKDGGFQYWCDEQGMLIILTFLTIVGLIYFQIVKPYCGKTLNRIVIKPSTSFINLAFSYNIVAVCFTLIVFGGLLTYIIIDAVESDEIARLQSLVGMVVLILGGFIFSTAPRKVIWRHVLWGIAIQFALGLFVLKWSVGKDIFQCFASKVTTFLSFSDLGAAFVFGDDLVYKLQIFAFKVLPVTLFFSFCIQILYYFGIMQWIVMKMGWCLQVTIGTTACESLNAAANIFLGQTEAPLLIKPYLMDMTKSEIHAVMTGGFATIAGAVMAAYMSFGIDAASLLSASVMNAPAALALSKLVYPEVEKSKTTIKDIKIEKGDEANWLHAALTGVTNALPMVGNIAANLICFMAFMELISSLTNWICWLAGDEQQTCRLENIFGYVFTPLAWVLGVKWIDCKDVGELIGLKVIINEFIAYERLAAKVEAGLITQRSALISTYALCGFSNISSIGIVLGGLSAMVPERRRDMATIVVRAMITGSCASFLTSCVAGVLLSAPVIDYNSTSTTYFPSSTEMPIYLEDMVL